MLAGVRCMYRAAGPVDEAVGRAGGEGGGQNVQDFAGLADCTSTRPRRRGCPCRAAGRRRWSRNSCGSRMAAGWPSTVVMARICGVELGGELSAREMWVMWTLVGWAGDFDGSVAQAGGFVYGTGVVANLEAQILASLEQVGVNNFGESYAHSRSVTGGLTNGSPGRSVSPRQVTDPWASS